MNPTAANTAGLSFKVEYFDEALSCAAAGLWYEIHPENYMIAGGPRLAMLDAVCAEHPLSVHGVGLSLAAAAEPDRAHLQRLRDIVQRVQPFVVSEHLSWSGQGGYLPDLLPFPRSTEALQRIARNIDITQEFLQRKILIENPSLYIQLPHEYSEVEFLSELVRRTGCGLLVDVNNAHISAHNLGGDAQAYLQALPAAAIGEIHLAGHAADQRADTNLLIDTHAAPVAEAVWDLYAQLITRIGARPTLIERDDNLPAFDILLAERERAARLLDTVLIPEYRHVRTG
jgi:uncharacterized protein (UPF0276 family)